MSWVTNVVLAISTSDASDGRIAEVNRYFDDKGGAPLVSVADPSLPKGWYGGTKYLEATLLIGAMNYFDLTGFYEHLRGIVWKYPEEVQLMVKEQEDFAFRLINVFPDVFAHAQEELASEWAGREIPETHAAIKLEQETRVSSSG